MNDQARNFDPAPEAAVVSAHVPRQPNTANDIGWPQTANRTYTKRINGRLAEIAVALDAPLPDLLWELSVDGESKGFFPDPLSARNEVRRICAVWMNPRLVLSFGIVAAAIITPTAFIFL